MIWGLTLYWHTIMMKNQKQLVSKYINFRLFLFLFHHTWTLWLCNELSTYPNTHIPFLVHSGSTAEGLHFLEQHGLRTALIGAIEAATWRCRQINKEIKEHTSNSCSTKQHLWWWSAEHDITGSSGPFWRGKTCQKWKSTLADHQTWWEPQWKSHSPYPVEHIIPVFASANLVTNPHFWSH